MKDQVFKIIYRGNYAEDHPSLLGSTGSVDLLGFSPALMGQGKSVQSAWPENLKIYVEGSEPVDFIRTAYFRIFSTAARDCILELASPGDVEFLKTNVVNVDTGTIYDDYWTVNVLRVLDVKVVDWERTVWASGDPPDPKGERVAALRPAFKLAEVEGVHIFHYSMFEGQMFGGVQPGIFVSQEIKTKLQSAKADKLIEFSPILTV